MKYHQIVLLLIIIVWFSVECQELKFNKNGRFKIVQFADMHYGEKEEFDVLSNKMQQDIIRWEKPDLVVVSGDAVSGYAYPDNTTCMRGGTAECWKLWTQPLINSNTKWAFIFGNHDDQADLTREQIVEIDMSFRPLSLTQKGPSDISGSTNYFLTVFSNGSSNPDPIFNIYMLDSGDNNCMGIKGWGCVMPDQVEWYRSTSQLLEAKYHRKLPAVAYVHIPFPEYMNVHNNFDIKGRKEEHICCFSVNTGLFAAFRERGEVLSTHCGHDHNNDYTGSYYNVTLSYGRKTGYGGYGPPKGWLRGARVLEFTQYPFSVKDYVRQEDGTIDDQGNSHRSSSENQYVCAGALGR